MESKLKKQMLNILSCRIVGVAEVSRCLDKSNPFTPWSLHSSSTLPRTFLSTLPRKVLKTKLSNSNTNILPAEKRRQLQRKKEARKKEKKKQKIEDKILINIRLTIPPRS